MKQISEGLSESMNIIDLCKCVFIPVRACFLSGSGYLIIHSFEPLLPKLESLNYQMTGGGKPHNNNAV